jgi:hypothetical protein
MCHKKGGSDIRHCDEFDFTLTAEKRPRMTSGDAFGSGPDYMRDPDAWYAEQAHFAKQFQNNPTAQISPEPAPTPWASPGGIHGQTLPGLDEGSGAATTNP